METIPTIICLAIACIIAVILDWQVSDELKEK
jgi:hypothetical protein